MEAEAALKRAQKAEEVRKAEESDPFAAEPLLGVPGIPTHQQAEDLNPSQQ